jgi:DNA primase
MMQDCYHDVAILAGLVDAISNVRAEGILAAVQMGAIEFHVRGTRADRPR